MALRIKSDQHNRRVQPQQVQQRIDDMATDDVQLNHIIPQFSQFYIGHEACTDSKSGTLRRVKKKDNCECGLGQSNQPAIKNTSSKRRRIRRWKLFNGRQQRNEIMNNTTLPTKEDPLQPISQLIELTKECLINEQF